MNKLEEVQLQLSASVSSDTSDVRPTSKRTREDKFDNSSATDEELVVNQVFSLRPNELMKIILQSNLNKRIFELSCKVTNCKKEWDIKVLKSSLTEKLRLTWR